jgi:hypothetical protein
MNAPAPKKSGAQVAPRPAPPPELEPAVGEPIRPSEPPAPAPPALPAFDPIGRPIAHAYALVPDPDRPGRYFALCLHDVVAGSYDHLESSGRSDMIPRGMMRINGAMGARHRARTFQEDEG